MKIRLKRKVPTLLVVSTLEKGGWLSATTSLDWCRKAFVFERVAVLKLDGDMGVAAHWAETKGLPVVLQKKGDYGGITAALVTSAEKFKGTVKALAEAGIPSRQDYSHDINKKRDYSNQINWKSLFGD